MKNLLKICGLMAGVVALAVSPWAFAVQAAFNSTGGGTYTLKSSISSTQTSITLTSFAEPVSGIPYTMSYINTSVVYATINPESANSEFISFTGITQNVNGSANLTGVTRGLSRTPGTDGCIASSTLKQPFPGQTRLILSAPPCFFSQYPVKSNDETITGQWTFSTFPITPASPPASETTAGIAELSTAAEAALGTSVGGTGFRLVLPGSLATSTYNSATAVGRIPVTDSLGHLSAGFVASSTLFSTTGFTDLQATSSVYIGDFPAWQIGKNSRIFSSTGTTTFAIPSGITKLKVTTVGAGAAGQGADAASTLEASGFGGGAGGCAIENVDVTGTTTVQVYVGTGGVGVSGTNGGSGSWSTFGTNGFYNSASGGLGNGNGGIGAGGDLNIMGGAGNNGGAVSAEGMPVPGGAGGATCLGFAGIGSISATGGDGTGAGAGGGGGYSANGAPATGGAGAGGLVLIEW